MNGDVIVPQARTDFQTIPEIIRAAKALLAPSLWDLASGGAESETTLRRNRLAMETYAFRPRLLRGVETPSLRTTFLGHSIDSPVILAPIGSIASFHPDGALAPARVAARRHTISCIGTLAWPSLTEVAAQVPGPHIFQLYVRGDRDWLRALVGRAEDAGYVALCFTADSPGGARRERDLHNRHRLRDDAARPNLPEGGGLGVQFQVRFNWDDFDWLRSLTRLPIILKGVLTAEDALLAVEHGADAIYVSNHGGRELDHLPAAMEVLAEIVEAVRGRAEVVVDSGFLRGTDVVKALALGARAVGIGKLQVWGLAAQGERGLEQALEILDEEMRHALRLIGVGTLDELTPSYVRPSAPTRASFLDWNQWEYAPMPSV